jgi:hypothetical protein
LRELASAEADLQRIVRVMIESSRSAFALKTAEGKMVKGSRSKVMIKGDPGSREALKLGMNCSVIGPADGEPSEIVCDRYASRKRKAARAERRAAFFLLSFDLKESR